MDIKAPSASSPAVHNVMIANRSKDTKPEITVRKMLRDAGYSGYRLHWRVNDRRGKYLCRPDISFPGRKVALFVHGCFWHRCPKCNLSLPKSNTEYWRRKFSRNLERDSRKESALIKLGWLVHTIWECSIQNGVAEVLEALTDKTNRP